MQARCRYMAYYDAYWQQTGVDADMRNLTLTFDWLTNDKFDTVNDHFVLELHITDGATTRHIYYYLNGTTSYTNTSTFGYYLVGEPALQWNTFSRNLTADYLAIPTFPGSITSNLLLTRLRFTTRAGRGTEEYLEVFIDDVNLLNETNGHEWIGRSTRNGDFETTGVWQRSGNYDGAELGRCSLALHGSWSANMTAASHGNISWCQLGQTPYVRATSLNQANLSFWWRVDDWQLATSDTKAYLYLFCSNKTSFFGIYYMLAYGGSSSPLSNSTTILVLHGDSFNTTGSWVRFKRNLWLDAASYFGTNEISVTSFALIVIVVGAGSSMTLLVEDAKISAAAVNGASFDDQGDPGTPIRGWGSGEYNEFTVTDTAYSGSLAANLTLENGESTQLGQWLQWRPLNGSRETYLDLVWRINDYTASGANRFYLDVDLEDGRDILYYLASTSGTMISNSTVFATFNVTGVNTVGGWIQMHRDLAHDYEAVFGVLPDTTIERIWLYGFTDSGCRLEVLMDDIYLYDDPAPVLGGWNQNPLAPNINEPADVTIQARDQDLEVVTLHYRTNGGAWQNHSMTHQSGDTYNYTIPGYPHGTTVEYYITANDTWGMTSTAMNGSDYWTYTIWDSLPPFIDTVWHDPKPPGYTDPANVSAIIIESGTGVKSVTLYYRVGGGLWQSTAMSWISGGLYRGQIPPQSWNTIVDYYVNASDWADNWAVDDNNGTYYYYVVGDFVNPIVSIISPSVNEEVSGTTSINVTASDEGSAINYVEFYIDGNLAHTDYTTPYSYLWDTTTVSDGGHMILVRAYDYAGNYAEDTVTVSVKNKATTTTTPTTPPIPGFPWEAVALALAAGLGVSLLRRRRVGHH